MISKIPGSAIGYPPFCGDGQHNQLEDSDWLTGRPRTSGDAQGYGNKEKLVTVLLGTGSNQAFGIDVINQAQPKQGNPQMDTKFDTVITDWALIQQIPGNASYVAFA